MVSNISSSGSRIYTSGKPASQLVFLTFAFGNLSLNDGGTCPVNDDNTGFIPNERSRSRIFFCNALWLSIQCCGNGPPHASIFPIQNQEKYAGPLKNAA